MVVTNLIFWRKVSTRENNLSTHTNNLQEFLLQSCSVLCLQRSDRPTSIYTRYSSIHSSHPQDPVLRKRFVISFGSGGKKNLLFQPLSAGTTNIALMVICALLSLSGFLQTLVSPESMSWTEESPRQISDRLPTQTNINQQTTVPITCLPFRTRFLLHHMVTNKGGKKDRG